MVTLLKVYAADPVAIDGIVMSRAVMTLAGLSSDEKPTGTYNGTLIANGSSYIEINTGKTYLYDEESSLWSAQAGGAGNGSSASMDLSAALDGAIASQVHNARVISLTGTQLASGSVIEAVGIPTYVSDVTQYAPYGITETGWYIFARVLTKSGEAIEAGVTVEGADGSIITAGEDHVDIAVRFEVASMSKAVTINWGTYTETYIFKATDLAVRNLDYRTTYYVYDLAPYATWVYRRSADLVFSGTKYYVMDNGEYVQAAVKARTPIPADTYYTHSYVMTEDTVFVDGTNYYTKEGTVYTPAEVVAGEEIPASTYYVDQWTLASGYFAGKAYYRVTGDTYEQIAVKAGEVCAYVTKLYTYPLPGTAKFVGTEYWAPDESDLGYSRAAVKAGEEIPEGEYFTHTYTKLTAAGKFAADTRYYKLVDGVYEYQEVTVGASYAKNVYYVDTWTEEAGEFVGTAYYLEQNGVNEQVAVIAGEEIPTAYYTQVISYELTSDKLFSKGKTYYIASGDSYVEAEITSATVFEDNMYYEQVTSYQKETGVFSEDVTYYTATAGVYAETDVVPGENIPDVEYHIEVITWPQALEDTFADGVTYYINLGAEYTVADVAVGDPIPVYMEHELLRIAGMTRNVTYRFDETIDCPMEIVLPVIEDGENYGAWFDFQFRHNGSYSTTLTPSENVKIATNNTPNATKGINLLHLHYSYIDGAKVWSALNTHTNFVED